MNNLISRMSETSVLMSLVAISIYIGTQYCAKVYDVKGWQVETTVS